MYQVLRSQGLGWTIAREALPAGVALLVAEAFYKFHSFTLELLAFAASWYALSWGFSWRFPGDHRRSGDR